MYAKYSTPVLCWLSEKRQLVLILWTMILVFVVYRLICDSKPRTTVRCQVMSSDFMDTMWLIFLLQEHSTVELILPSFWPVVRYQLWVDIFSARLLLEGQVTGSCYCITSKYYMLEKDNGKLCINDFIFLQWCIIYFCSRFIYNHTLYFEQRTFHTVWMH